MPSPDFQEYIDLTINDKQPGDIYDEAVEYARLAMPEFSPRPGTIEDSILQAAAYIGAANLGNINRIPDGIMEGVLRFMDLLRKESTFGSVNISFTLSEPGGTVPKGTLAVHEIVSGDEIIQFAFSTNTTVVASSASVTVTVPATSLTAGILPVIGVNTQLTLAQPSSTIIDAHTAGNVTQGALAETTNEYFARGTTHLETITSVLATAQQVQKYIIANFVDVGRCKVYDVSRAATFTPPSASVSFNGFNNTNDIAVISSSNDFINLCNEDLTDLFMVLAPDYYGDDDYISIIPTGVYIGASSGSSSVSYSNLATSASGFAGPITLTSMNSIEQSQAGDTPGHFVIFVSDSVGAPIIESVKTEIRNQIEERISAGINFEILDIYPVDLSFTVTLSVSSEYGASSIATNVANSVESLVSLQNWPDFESQLRIFDIVVSASKVEGVEYVYSVTSSLPSYPGAQYPGNELLALPLNLNGNLIGYDILHLGVLPRATVEVVVI